MYMYAGMFMYAYMNVFSGNGAVWRIDE